MSIHRNRMVGLSLIELMIAMVLGLLIMAGVASIFSANSQINRSSQNVSRVQETARTVFELMGRDLRESGVNGCGRISNDSVHNVLTGAGTAALWWANWTGGIIGYEAGTVLAGFRSAPAWAGAWRHRTWCTLMHGSPSVFQVVTHNTARLRRSSIRRPGSEHHAEWRYRDGLRFPDGIDLPGHQQSLRNRQRPGACHGGGFAPGNSSVGLGGSGLTYAYPPNANVMRLESSTWYVGKQRPAGQWRAFAVSSRLAQWRWYFHRAGCRRGGRRHHRSAGPVPPERCLCDRRCGGRQCLAERDRGEDTAHLAGARTGAGCRRGPDPGDAAIPRKSLRSGTVYESDRLQPYCGEPARLDP